ncbi:hypothetical protein [Tsukamurella spumae]|uniref:Secreted protein n=1 Tax=Tsukamurella spumae TaxID=44753 RepID=A0A846WZL8_9ACTN|nr:hypothetical protein [Tsukamurella spumae]NKY17472.1 hypothetical protein [Tsukamurella spumae]
MKNLALTTLTALLIASGSVAASGTANADVGWIGPFSSSWTCEQNAWSWGWQATCERGDDGWYWWSPR